MENKDEILKAYGKRAEELPLTKGFFKGNKFGLFGRGKMASVVAAVVVGAGSLFATATNANAAETRTTTRKTDRSGWNLGGRVGLGSVIDTGISIIEAGAGEINANKRQEELSQEKDRLEAERGAIRQDAKEAKAEAKKEYKAAKEAIEQKYEEKLSNPDLTRGQARTIAGEKSRELRELKGEYSSDVRSIDKETSGELRDNKSAERSVTSEARQVESNKNKKINTAKRNIKGVFNQGAKFGYGIGSSETTTEVTSDRPSREPRLRSESRPAREARPERPARETRTTREPRTPRDEVNAVVQQRRAARGAR